ncbi:MAG: hypothetical protein JWM11_7981 [Planctomycetaceae bacterium]|nr:hypothetical protein [Planctomycetaceae bacterium]
MKSIRSRLLLAAALLFAGYWEMQAEAADIDASLKTILKVGPEGQGNAEAAAAWKDLSKGSSADLAKILPAFDNANPLAANWLRSAFEAIADREFRTTGKLPQADLEQFIAQTQHDPRARRMAFEWLLKVDAGAADRLIPGMLQDPSTEFRRDAVARLIISATKSEADGKTDEAKAALLKAIDAARDEDQVEAIMKPLDKLGAKVDLARHFGFILDWQLIGPFDNTQKKGFEISYAPESELKLDGKYAGQKGDVSWSKYVTDEKYGLVDLSKVTAPQKGSVTYASTVFTSDKDQTVDLRLGTPNAWKLWVNGAFVFGREEYHRGMAIDQYRMRAQLKKGPNQILLKICQNEQTEEWAQRWQFQLRVCDKTGTAILSTTRDSKAPVASTNDAGKPAVGKAVAKAVNFQAGR